jgi:hypothetical protein
MQHVGLECLFGVGPVALMAGPVPGPSTLPPFFDNLKA